MRHFSRLSALSWGLYDWANSAFPTVITTFVFATYFTETIAKNTVEGTYQWGKAMALAGFIIAVLSPFLGSAVDYLGKRKLWVGGFTILSIVSTALLWFAKPSSHYIYWALTWAIIGTVGFEMAVVFYNAMMRDLIPKNYWGRLSGWSFGLGYFGGLACLMIALILVQTKFTWIPLDISKAENIRIVGPLVAIWFATFSLPFFFFTSDTPPQKISFKQALKKGTLSLLDTFKKVKKNRQVLKFLLARMIYIDGLNTLFTFGGIYAAGTFGFNSEQLIIFGIAMNITAGIGAISFGWIDDYLGSKITILFALSSLIALGIGLLTTHSNIFFWIFALLLGLFVGPVQAASRSLLTRLARPSDLTQLFGLYAFSGKMTAFIGPWLLGFATVTFASQRIGMASILLFFMIGGGILLKVKNN
jgi:MFS transporter, UMF1 family